jgi:hypothetical protein
MERKLLMPGKWRPMTVIYVLSLGLLGLAGFWLFCLRGPERVIWVAASDEEIRAVQTAETPGHIYVGSQRGGRWFLRDLKLNGQARLIANGSGGLQAVGGISPSSWQGTKVLLGVVAQTGPSHYQVLECNLRTGTVTDFPSLRGATTFGLHQPFSPDGRFSALLGSGHPGSGVFLYNSATKQVMRVWKSRGIPHVSWSSNGNLNVYVAPGGALLKGSASSGLTAVGELPFGSFGYIMPDGQSVIITQQDSSSLTVIQVLIRDGRQHTLYRKVGTDVASATICGIQHASWSGESVIDLMRPHVRPILIGPTGGVEEIDLGEASWWRLMPGIALIEHGAVAFVRKEAEASPDEIVFRNVR